MINITTTEMINAIKAFRKEGINTDYSNIIIILLGIQSGNFGIFGCDDIANLLEDAYIDGYDTGVGDCAEADRDFKQELNDAYDMGYNAGYNEAYWKGYNDAREAYDGTSDDDYEEPDNIDDDFGYDAYMGCYTYDC